MCHRPCSRGCRIPRASSCQCRPQSGGKRAQSAAQDNDSDAVISDSDAVISDSEAVSKRFRLDRGAAASPSASRHAAGSQPATSAGQGGVTSAAPTRAASSRATLRAQSQASEREDDAASPLEAHLEAEPSQLNADMATALQPPARSTEAPATSSSQRTVRQQHVQPMQPSTAHAADTRSQGSLHAAQPSAAGLQSGGPKSIGGTTTPGMPSDMPSFAADGVRSQQPAASHRHHDGLSGDAGTLFHSAGSQPGPGSLLNDQLGLEEQQPVFIEGPSALLSSTGAGVQHSSSIMAPVSESNRDIDADIHSLTDEQLGCVRQNSEVLVCQELSYMCS